MGRYRTHQRSKSMGQLTVTQGRVLPRKGTEVLRPIHLVRILPRRLGLGSKGIIYIRNSFIQLIILFIYIILKPNSNPLYIFLSISL